MQLVVPQSGGQTPEQIVRDLSQARSLPPFSDVAIEFAARLSSTLMRETKTAGHPELQALGFWMRKAELVRLQKEFQALQGPDHVLVPRGLVFHVPPANVDTIFVYSWLLALLTGNRNVVRVSTRGSEVVDVLCTAINKLLAEEPFQAVRAGTRFVRYGHDRDLTTAFSRVADVRVLWGGDRTVRDLRTIPLPPHAKELTFPDRWSLAAIQASSWLESDAAARAALAVRFFNDAYWFDQLGCSSPQLVVFCGEAAACQAAEVGFFNQLAETVDQRGVRWETRVVLDKILHAHQAAIDQSVRNARLLGNGLTVVQLADLQRLDRSHPGGGFFYSTCVERLTDLAPFLRRQDQTLTVFGTSPQEVKQLVTDLNGRALDRIVPIGQALSFHRFWDGYDLLQELTRLVHVNPEAKQLPG